MSSFGGTPLPWRPSLLANARSINHSSTARRKENLQRQLKTPHSAQLATALTRSHLLQHQSPAVQAQGLLLCTRPQRKCARYVLFPASTYPDVTD